MPFPFDFVLAIIGMVLLFKLIKLRMQQPAEHAAPASDEHDDLLDRLKKLEQRIAVLERIVTDRRSDLDRQFEELGG